MEARERIAFALFKTDYPPQMRADIQMDQLGQIRTDFGSVTLTADLTIDWNEKRTEYLLKADAALSEMDAIVAERRGA